ncbi:MAG: hypothetical protein CVU56_10730 [Deltaproteobacteria bacterium HGW-Deltaproteobacteria-14]|jgi:cytochrome c-type biogenesis protein CcmH|nr:MAG: hypothetical protein CVU56_10730 [Deltaproteobacteria bacterium HGW-Deltaproteobacteria-14]
MTGARAMVGAGLLLGLSLFVGSSAQAQRRGEPVVGESELALGPDVPEVVGAPAGPPLTGPELEKHSWGLAMEIRCPVCQGQAIAESPAESARHMKRQVRAMVAAGYSDDQIFRYLENSYGEFIRLSPRPEGLNLLVWVLPLVALVIGAGVIVWLVGRKDPRKAPANAVAEAEVDTGLAPWLERVRREAGEDVALREKHPE